MYTLIGTYVGIQTGIGFDGYRFLKRNGKQKVFFKFLVQSIIGLISGLLISFLSIAAIEKNITHAVTNCLSIALPLAGAIIGFDFRLMVNENKNV